jgi:hypothetical protein
MAGKSLTVLQLLPALESGGVERGTLELGAGLVHAGHRSLVISAGGQLVSRLTGQGSEHFQWPIGRKSLWSLRLVKRLQKFIVNNRVDILHARSRMPAWIAWLAWRGLPQKSRPRFVTSVHGLYSVSRYSSIMVRGEAVIAVSEAAQHYILEQYPHTETSRLWLRKLILDAEVIEDGLFNLHVGAVKENDGTDGSVDWIHVFHMTTVQNPTDSTGIHREQIDFTAGDPRGLCLAAASSALTYVVSNDSMDNSSYWQNTASLTSPAGTSAPAAGDLVAYLEVPSGTGKLTFNLSALYSTDDGT